MTPEPGIPLLLEDEADTGVIRQSSLPYDPDISQSVDDVLLAPDQHDGLEARFSTDDEDEALVILVQEWNTLAPDDPKGELLQARVTAAVVRKMDHLISRTRGEIWQTRSDFLREAIWTYVRSVIQALQTKDPTLLTLITEAELAGRAHFHNTRRHRLEDAMTDMSSYLTDLINLDDYEEAYRMLLETALRLRRMHVIAWKRQWLVALNSLPILKVTVRLLDMHGWDIPVEFFPAAGKSALASILPPIPLALTPAPPTPTPPPGGTPP